MHWDWQSISLAVLAVITVAVFLIGFRQHYNASDAMAVNHTMSRFSGFGAHDEFDRAFNAIGTITMRRGRNKMVFSAIVLIIVLGLVYLKFRY